MAVHRGARGRRRGPARAASLQGPAGRYDRGTAADRRTAEGQGKAARVVRHRRRPLPQESLHGAVLVVANG